MRFLIITQYYPPESGAPQNRLSGLALQLLSAGHSVEVLTAMPNYPDMMIKKEYKGKFYFNEILNDVQLHRSWIYASKNRSFISRLLNYFSFVFTSLLIATRIKGPFDYVLCESPPLFLGISAVWIAKRKKAKLIFNVSDLWPESAEKLGMVSKGLMLSLSYKLEKWLYYRSVLITGQTQGICENIVHRFPDRKVHWLPNGIDAGRYDPSLKSDWRIKNNFSHTDFILMYGGIIGHAQGLEVIIQAAKLISSEKDIHFVFLGDGPEKEKLMQLADSLNLSNIHFMGLIQRDQMANALAASNAAIIPLRKLDLFMGAIPSKIFENLAMKKPVLLGVDGEARKIFVEQGKCSLYFEPDNSKDLAEKIIHLYKDPILQKELGRKGVEFVYENFDRKKIVSNFLSKLKEI